MSVGEICNREVIICLPDESVSDAIDLMRDQHVGCVVVVQSSGRSPLPIGILTDRDIVIRVLRDTADLTSIRVDEVMSHDLVTAYQDDDVIDTMQLMRDKGIRRVPVINSEGGLEGILAVDDLVELLAEQLTDLVRLCGREIRRERAAGMDLALLEIRRTGESAYR